MTESIHDGAEQTSYPGYGKSIYLLLSLITTPSSPKNNVTMNIHTHKQQAERPSDTIFTQRAAETFSTHLWQFIIIQKVCFYLGAASNSWPPLQLSTMELKIFRPPNTERRWSDGGKPLVQTWSHVGRPSRCMTSPFGVYNPKILPQFGRSYSQSSHCVMR